MNVRGFKQAPIWIIPLGIKCVGVKCKSNAMHFRDMKAKHDFQHAKYKPHQGKKECARRLRQGLTT